MAERRLSLVTHPLTRPVACRLPPAACRLPPAARRLPPAACLPPVQAKRGNRSVLFYGETAYWVNVDVDVPLFLPIYAQRRLHDLRRIAGREIKEGFRIQVSGEEGSYEALVAYLGANEDGGRSPTPRRRGRRVTRRASHPSLRLCHVRTCRAR